MFTTSIAAADADGDECVDVLVGNLPASNQLLLNKGIGCFYDTIELPGLFTSSIAAADIDEDGNAGILVSNFGNNQLLLNKGDEFFHDAIELLG